MFQIPSEWYAEQQARQESIKQICRGLQAEPRGSVSKFTISNLYVNDEYKFLFCKIPKVASSTFVAIFLYLAGITNSTSVNASRLYENENLHSRLVTLGKLSESEATWRLSNYTKFFFTRNPLTRLYSAYKNKFANEENKVYPNSYGKRIIKEYRLNASEDDLKTGKNVRFEEFAAFLADSHGGDNIHWARQTVFCSPCHIKYDYIGHYETFLEDTENILKVLNLDHLIQIPHINPSNRNTSKTTFTSLKEMYRNVSLSDLHKLWEYYKTDFLLSRYGYPYLTDEST